MRATTDPPDFKPEVVVTMTWEEAEHLRNLTGSISETALKQLLATSYSGQKYGDDVRNIRRATDSLYSSLTRIVGLNRS